MSSLLLKKTPDLGDLDIGECLWERAKIRLSKGLSSALDGFCIRRLWVSFGVFGAWERDGTALISDNGLKNFCFDREGLLRGIGVLEGLIFMDWIIASK